MIDFKQLKVYFDEIVQIAKDEGMQIYFPELTKDPIGQKQDCDSEIFDHEYVDQKTGISCDDYYGKIYFPISDGYYLSVSFNM